MKIQVFSACLLWVLAGQHPPLRAVLGSAPFQRDSVPDLTMPIVEQLAAARRAIDSLARIHPLASSQIPAQDMPRTIAGRITLRTAELRSNPLFAAAVQRNGFSDVAAYARTFAWLDAAWSVIIAEHNAGRSGDTSAASQGAPPEIPQELVAFAREHESALLALGFTPPPPYVPWDVTSHDYFTRPPYLRQFFDSSAHTIRIVTTSVSDYLQGFIDSADVTPAGAAKIPPLRVLFLGNSLTYYHAMPRLFADLASAGLHRRVVAGLVSLPGSTLPQLWTETDLAKVLAQWPWDVVVIQIHPVGDITTTNDLARRISAPILARGGQAVVWGQYASPGEDPAYQGAFDTIFANAAQAAQAKLAPVPAAWDAVRQADTVTWKGLFDDLPHRDMHPSPSGSYLMAITFYRVITGQSPVGLPNGMADLTLPQADASRLQHIVASVQ